jgi:hypothetical protein
MKALHLVEKTLGIKVSKLDMEELSLYETAVFIWAGLTHEDTSLDPEKVMDIIDEHSNMPHVMEKVGEALEEAFGAAKGKGARGNVKKATKV